MNAPAARELQCVARGCVLSRWRHPILRLGWTLAEGTTAGAHPAELEPKSTAIEEPPVPAKPDPKLRWTCEQGPLLTELAKSDVAAFAPSPTREVAWARYDEESVTFAPLAKPPRTVKLLPPHAPPYLRRFRHQRASNEQGLAVARYVHDLKDPKTGSHSPVDTDLAWLRWSDGKVHRAKLTATFRVTDTHETAILAVTEAGLVFMPRRGDQPLRVLRDDGTETELPRPALDYEARPTEIVGHGSTFDLLASEWRGETSQMTFARFDGASWTQRTWALFASPTLRSFGSQPVWLWPDGAFERVPSPLPVDPTTHGAPQALEPTSPVCPSALGPSRVVSSEVELAARVAPDETLTGAVLVGEVGPSSVCLRAADLGGALIPFATPSESTLFTDHRAYRLRCKAVP